MKNIYVCFFALILLFGCMSKKNISEIQEGYNDPIHIAINDLLKKPKSLKNKQIFSVRVFVNNDTLVAISILDIESRDKFNLDREEKIVGTHQTEFPSGYIEKEGKFFYWNDSTKEVSQEIFDKLLQYDLLEFSPEKWFLIIDDSKKAMHYYFCKNDLSVFKKVKTSIAIGWYPAPKLKCGK